jgi:hypothetical protein
MKGLKSQLLVIGCLLACLSSAASAQFTLSPGSTQTGSIGSAGGINTYAFTASAGDVFDFTVTTTKGSLSPEIRLYNSAGTLLVSAANNECGGSGVELNTALIPANGTYSVWVSDCSNTNTGNYVLYSQRINDPIGAVSLAFGQTVPGTIGFTSQSNTYTFSANAGDEVYLDLVVTSGNLAPKIRLYDPNGTLNTSNANNECGGPALETTTAQLPATGVYTLLVGDCSDTNTGNYELYSQRTDNPGAPVVPLLFGQTEAGMIGSAGQSNTYTFSANAGDVVYLDLVVTSGNLAPKIRLYDPNGTLNISNANNECGGPALETTTAQLPVTGVYTLLVGDCSDTNTGNYELYSQRTNNPRVPVVPLLFGQTGAGMIGSAAQSNTYTFSANAGDVIYLDLVVTSGNFAPKIHLYDPNGTLNISNANNECGGPALETTTAQLPVTGVYTLLVGDCSDTNTGNYELYSQRTNNPTGPVPVDWGLTQTGRIGLPAQSNTYTFAGSAKNVVDLTMVVTSGTLTPKIRLYLPDGSLNSTAANNECGGPSVEMSSVTLPVTGTYTVLVGDCSDTNTGTYSLTSECFGICPTPQVPKPVFSPEGGTYPGPLMVTVTDADTTATIYYTTDGSTPTTSSSKYTTPISVTASGTIIKAIAAVTGYATSPVHSGTYIFTTAKPVFTPAGGTYTSVQMVTITDGTTGAVSYYTTDGSTPTTSSVKYTTPIPVTVSGTIIKAIAQAPGYAISPVHSGTYLIIGSPSALAAPATDVSTPDATLNAIVNTLGLAGSYIFEYGTSTALGSTTPKTPLPASTAPVNASAQLTGLTTKTTYYFQVVVTTAGGTSSGSVLSFTTN